VIHNDTRSTKCKCYNIAFVLRCTKFYLCYFPLKPFCLLQFSTLTLNVHCVICHEGTESIVIVYCFFNFGARWVGELTPRPGRFSSGNDPGSVLLDLGGPKDQPERVRESSPPPGFYPQTVQPERFSTATKLFRPTAPMLN
jgi:hypothetical protein